MNQCGRLFRVEKAYAYYVETEKHVVVAADVFVTPGFDKVHICPNPIAPIVGAREFIVEGTTRPGIHPMVVVKERIVYSYPSDATPKSVIVYSMGVDAPVRQEVPLGPPPPAIEPQAKTDPGPPPPAAPSTQPGAPAVEVTGYSQTFSFEEAIHDALAQAAAKLPRRNPDVGVLIEVTKITARSGGNIRPGLFVTGTGK